MKSILWLSILVVQIAFAQYPPSPNQLDETGKRTGHWTILLNKRLYETDIADSIFFYGLVSYEKGKPVGKSRIFFRSTKNKMWEGFAVDFNPLPVVHDGESREYFENGKLESILNYKNGQLNGPTKLFNNKGILLIEGSYRDNVAEGFWTYYHDTGEKYEELVLKGGKVNGEVNSYYTNGALKKKANQVNSLEEGLVEEFYKNGNRNTIHYRVNGKRHGSWEWFNEHGIREEKGEFYNDTPVGEWEDYYKDGITLASKGKKDSLGRQGYWEYYFETGERKEAGHFVNDKKTGQWNYYYTNGKIYNAGIIENGLYEGEWVTYYEDGSLKSKKIWQRDTLNGPVVFYYQENGIVQVRGNNKNGNRDGTYYFYSQNGMLDGVENYETGQLNGPAYNYYPNGVLKDSGRYANGLRTGEWRWYYDNKQLKFRYIYVNGKFEGPFEDYYSNGNKMRIGVMKNDGREGWIKYYYFNGRFKNEGLCRNDLAEGKWIYYDSITGRRNEIRNYVNNKLHGKSVHYDSRGKLEWTNHHLHGFLEEIYTIADSIEVLIKAERYDMALRAMPWLKKVMKRDGWANSEHARLVPKLYSSIAYEQKNYEDALRWQEQALKIIKKYRGDTAVIYLRYLNDHANIYTKLGRWDQARAVYIVNINHDSLKSFKKTYWVGVSNYASTLNKQGQREEALRFIESRLANFKEKEGESSSWVIEGYYAFGRFYNYNLNEPDNSIPYYTTLFGLVEKSDDKDERLQELKRIASSSLAVMYRDKANSKASIPWYKKAISVFEKGVKTDYGTYMRWQVDMAYAYVDLAQFDSALAVYNKAFDQMKDQKEFFSQQYADALNGKAFILKMQGKREEALAHYLEAKSLLERTNESKSNAYYNILTSLTNFYSYESRYQEAAQFQQQAASIVREKYGTSASVYARALNRLSDFYRDSKQFKLSLETVTEARNILERNNDTNGRDYALCMHYMGMTLAEMYDYKQALICNKSALQIFQKNIGEVQEYSEALRQRHYYFKNLKQYDSAESYIQRAIQVVEKSYGINSDRYLGFKAANAWLYKDQSLYTKAHQLFVEVMDGYKLLMGENTFGYLHAVRNVGRSYLDQSEYKKAEPYYQLVQSTLVRNGKNKTQEMVDATFRLAEINRYTGNKLMAGQLYRRAADLCREVLGHQHVDYAYYLKELAMFHYTENETQKAEEILTNALMALGESPVGTTDALYGRYLIDMAKVKSKRNKNKEAEDLYKLALSIMLKDRKNKDGYYVEGLAAYAQFLEKMGRYQNAEKVLLELLDIYEKAGGRQFGFYYHYYDLISLYKAWGKRQKALEFAGEMLAYAENELSRTHWMMTGLQGIMGLIYFDERDFEKAEKHFQYCLEADRLLGEESYAYINNMGNTLLAQNKLGLAETHLLKTQEIIGKKDQVLSPLSNIHVTDNLAALYQAQGRMAEAEKVWLEVIQKSRQYTNSNFYFLSDEEKAQFWASIKEEFEYFNTFAVLRSRTNPSILGTMYNNQLATKAILFSASNKVKNRILSSNDESMITNYYNWVEARENLSQYYSLSSEELKTKKTAVDSLQAHINNLEKELSISAQDASRDMGNSNIDWRDVQKSLASNEAAIEIIRYRHFDRYMRDSVLYAALVLTSEAKTNPKLVVLPNGKLLEGRNLRFYKNAITSKIDDRVSYNAYWGPIEPLVKGKTRIYLSLDGVYNQINLNTLADEQGKFLVDSKNLTIVSNTKDLLLLKGKKVSRKQTGTASLFGYPKYFIGKDRIKEKVTNQKREVDFTMLDERDATEINELPGTKTEVEQVRDILKNHQWNAIDFTDENATEKALKSISYPSVLHIATHGFFVDENETSATFNLGTATEYAKQNPLLRSGVLLSAASNFIQNNFRLDDENGILTAYEASNLNLDHTDLVVLSACETGKGEVQNGEGVYGLQRAFQTAGAQAIIMSLWKVDDTATQELMSSFYENWMSGSTKAEAFRKAQLQLKSKYNSPYYWGAFVMMGE